ncbi:CWC15 [Sergentomyia squamirostris]
MTTAARPTFDPARGGSGRGEKDLSALSKQYSSRDLPGHTKLKYREQGQGNSDELRNRDFRKELEEREGTKGKATIPIPAVVRRAIEQNAASASKKPKLDQIPAANLDADDPVDGDSSDSDDSDDDTAVLLAELNKIKRERAQDANKRETQRKQEEERIRMENILSGNPLLNYCSAPRGDLKVKRRWDDDVVFKNCARYENSSRAAAFINDSLRSEFHKKFMDKYIK